MKRYIILGSFVVMVLAQWYVPFQMISGKERILREGKEFRFLTQPYDPYDAFRGKYIHLNFQQTSIRLHGLTGLNPGDMVYAIIGKDSSGFALLTDVSKEKPAVGSDYLKVDVSYFIEDTVSYVSIVYPFDRFYLEESKASYADQAYLEASRDTSMVTYAKVRIHDGESVIQDVYIDGVPIAEVARKRQLAEQQ
jgi:uncharacterized membrane-anchored protein